MSNARPIRTLLVDDHVVLREGLAHLLDAVDGITVIDQAGDGFEAATKALEQGPDVVVLDIGLPELDGVDVCKRITSERPDIRVVVLTMHDDAKTVDRALRAGARAYVLKGAGSDRVIEAIRAAHEGRIFLDPLVSEFVVRGYLDGSGATSPVDPLTTREREVLKLIAEGFTSREVADRLGLQPKTVQNYRSLVMDKVGARTTAGLVRYALRAGLVAG